MKHFCKLVRMVAMAAVCFWAAPLAGIAQQMELEWAETIGGTGDDYFHMVDTDHEGNVYAVGTFQATVDFDFGPGQYLVTSFGGYDGFLAKYSKDGDLLWFKHLGSDGDGEQTLWVSVNDSGTKVAITGRIRGDINFGTADAQYVQGTNGYTDSYLAVYSVAGTLAWAQSFGGSGWDQGLRVEWYKSELYATGEIHGSVNMNPRGGSYVVTAGVNHFYTYLAKYSADGILKWAGVAGRGDNPTYSRGLAVDRYGNAYITGYLFGDVDFDFGSDSTIVGTLGGADGYLVKYDSLGQCQWGFSVGNHSTSSGHEDFHGVVVDGDALYVTGRFYYSTIFDIKNKATPAISSKGEVDGFVAKYSLDGDYIWARTFGSANDDGGVGLAITPLGEVVVSGYCQGPTFTMGNYSWSNTSQNGFWGKLDADGNVIYGGPFISSGTDYAHYLAVDPFYGSVYITGTYGGDPFYSQGFEETQFGNAGIRDGFLFKFKHNYYDIVQQPLYDCAKNTVHIPLYANQPLEDGVIGLDVCLDYDETILEPTRRVYFGELMQPAGANPRVYLDDDGNTMEISLYFNDGESTISGQGLIAYVEFDVVGGAGLPDGALLARSCGMWESHTTHVVERLLTPIDYIFNRDDRGKVVYWDDALSPLKYRASQPTKYNETLIVPTDADGVATGHPVVRPDEAGKFELQTEYTHLKLERDVLGGGADVPCPVSSFGIISGEDLYATRNVTVRKGSAPSAYQMLAMDVNRDGAVSAGDMTLIMARALGKICEFPQGIGYDSTGNNSKDWLFMDGHTVATDAGYVASSSFPEDDGVGYSRHRLPVVPAALAPPTDSTPCNEKLFHAVLLGDVDGSWRTYYTKNNLPNVIFRTQEARALVLDVDAAVVAAEGLPEAEGWLYVPVRYSGVDALTSMDLLVAEDLPALGAPVVAPGMSGAYELGHGAAPFRVVSYALEGGVRTEEAVWYLPVREAALPGLYDLLAEAQALVNGEKAAVRVGNRVTGVDDVAQGIVLYPNPAHDVITLQHAEWAGQQATVRLRDMRGVTVLAQEVVLGPQLNLAVGGFDRGVYLLEVASGTQRWHGRFVKE